MGHYDSCYEADDEERAEKRAKEINNRFDKLSDKLSVNHKEFLLKIADNINDYVVLFKMIINKK